MELNWFGFEFSTFLWVFIVLNVVNVIIQTVKSIVTVNGGKMSAAIINAVTYAIYTVVVVFMTAEGLGILWKAIIIGIANFGGVYVVKLIEEKGRKDKLWKVEATFAHTSDFIDALKVWADVNNISYNYIDIEKYYVVNFYAPTQKESAKIKNFINLCHGKYFVSESKTL